MAALCFTPAWSHAEHTDYTPNLFGPLGLNSVPSARMSDAGTLTAGLSTLDPYVHSFIAFQLAEPLFIGLRQSAEISNINDDAKRLYPGLDFKLRLFDETRFRPALALGFQSALGHKRMAGEYLALSKRYKSFDFTAGIGWGRFGSAGHMDNPLKIASHFDKSRTLDGEMPHEPADWFTGEQVGFFGGIEYFTPLEGLSLKFDLGADRHAAERAAFDYEVPPAWSAGISYTPKPWVNAALAAQGTDKIMGRLSFQTNPKAWPWKGYKRAEPRKLRTFRTGLSLPSRMMDSAQNEGLELHDIARESPHSASGALELAPDKPAPFQYGRAVRHMAAHAGPALERFTLTPRRMGLQGSALKLMRADFERALGQNQQGSAEEIWRNAEFPKAAPDQNLRAYDRSHQGFHTSLILDNQASLAEEDSGALYRSALVLDMKRPAFFGFLTGGAALRLNLADNLNRLTDMRPRALLPVRSDVDLFARRTLSLERSYVSFLHTLKPGFHLQASAGYLEEMYAGFGGEILYRPFDSRLALGAESWIALKRDPLTDLNLGLTGDNLLTGHLNAWYDLPRHDLTLGAKIGRYLAEDFGASFSLAREFSNGAQLEASMTLTDKADYDLFGGTTHAYHGIKFTMPLGGLKYAPRNSHAAFTFAPFGRDTGQALAAPLALYEITESFSLRHLEKYWPEILE